MLEIIQDVLAAEKRAEEKLEQVRADVARKRAEFSEEETRRVREAETEADRVIRERLAAAREEQDRRVAEVGAELREAEKRFETEGRPGLDEAVRAATELVIRGAGSRLGPQDG